MSRYLTQRALCHPALPLSRKLTRRALPPIELSAAEESFYERLGEDADVRLEPGINQDEVFDDQFERRAHEIQRTPPASSAMSIIPAKVGPWTANNQLGIERHFAPDTNNEQTILKLDEWGFPEVWTLCLGINDYSFSPNPDPIAFDITASVQFGCGGVIQEVEVDWLNGSAIVLPMNALNLVARYAQFSGSEGGASSIPDNLRLRANIVRGALPHARPTRTIYTAENQTVVEIPKFAKSVFIAPGLSLPGIRSFAFYGDGSYVRFMSNETTVIGSCPAYLTSQFVSYIDFTNELVGGPMWIPIPAFARFIQYEDSGASPQAFDTGTCVQFEIGV